MRAEQIQVALQDVRLPDAHTGRLVDLGALPGVAVLTLVRHRFCLLCHEHLVVVQRLLGGEIPLVTVGFSPPAALASLADGLGLSGPVLADEARLLYRMLGLGRAPWWRIYSPATLAFYARVLTGGTRLPPPADDTRQLGADALVVDGVVVRLWRPSTPAGRVRPELLAAAARTA